MIESRAQALLRKKIEEVINTHTAQIVSGQVSDYAQYREGVGYVHGLIDAVKLLDEVASEIAGGA